MLSRREKSTRCTPAWRTLYEEYGIGNLRDNNTLIWTRDDLKLWQSLIDKDRLAHEKAKIGADRTEVAKYTANEKMATASIRNKRIFCHAINAPLYLDNIEQIVHPGIEYRAPYDIIDINRYNACIIIENQESFIYCQRFIWPKLPATLVLYRGHDKSAQAVQELLKTRSRSLGVYIFPDTDPAGMGIAMSMKDATHIIAPDVRSLDPKGLLRDRFTIQLQKRPDLQAQTVGFSHLFQNLVADIINTGTAVSQEWLCAHRVKLNLIPLLNNEKTIL